MTVQTTTSVQSFLGDGVTKTFPFSFKFEDVAHILARYILPGPTYQMLAPFVDYTVGAAAGNVGGTLTTTVPVPLGVTLQIFRLVPLTQLLDYVANDQFPAEASETALDLIVEGMQQINDAITGTLEGTLGGIASIINEGSGLGIVGLFDTLTGTTAAFLSLEAGANITLTDTGQTVRIDATGGGAVTGALLAANNLSDVASLQQSIDNITQATTAPNEYVWTKDTATGKGKWKVVPTGGAGEANTMSSLGGTTSIVGTKSGVNLPVRGFTAGANIALTQRANDILIDASAAGEANDGINVGFTGQGWYAGKQAQSLRFKGHAPGLGIKVASASNDVTTSIDTAAILTWTNAHTFRGTTGTPGNSVTDPGYPLITAQLPATFTRRGVAGGKGTIGTALYVQAEAPSNELSFNWAFVVNLQSNANNPNDGSLYSPENVGITSKAYKGGTAPVWSGVFEAHDRNMSNQSLGGCFGLEIDCMNQGISNGLECGILMTWGESGNTGPSGITTSWDHGILMTPFANNARFHVKNGITFNGCYEAAVLNMGGAKSTPVALAMAGGSALLFGSGTGGNAGGAPTWYPGGFVPAFSGALRIYVDGTPEYIPTCSNHP